MAGAVISVVQVGLGGFGSHFVASLLDEGAARQVRMVAGVDPSPDRCPRLADLQARGIPIYPSLEAFFAAGGKADLVSIASPLQLHCQQTVLALSHGCHVLCEKPIAATVQQAAEMKAARDQAKKIVAIGYQWSFSSTILNLKRDILAGRFGAPQRLRTLVLWPRDEAYYARAKWAGRQTLGGLPVFDSPVNNATAHYLHNMLFLLGEKTDAALKPASLTAELYRANPIENFDTASIRLRTAAGVELYFHVSHALTKARGPICEYQFEKATVVHDESERFVARFADGSTHDYGTPTQGVPMEKLYVTADAIRTGAAVPCGIETASAHTACIAAIQASPTAGIVEFPKPLVRIDGTELGKRRWSVDGLGEVLERCFAENKLPSELGVSWAQPARTVAV